MVEDGGLNLLIGVSEQEHDYVRRSVQGKNRPRAYHHRPPGFTHLQTALEQCAAGVLVLADRSDRSLRLRLSSFMTG